MYTTRDSLLLIMLHTTTFYFCLCKQLFQGYLPVLLLGQVQVNSANC